MKSYYNRKRQQLMASAWVDKPQLDKWEFIEERLRRAMTLDELKDYIGYVDSKGKFKPPRKGHYAVPPDVELSEINGDALPDEDRDKLLDICVASKRGVRISAEDQAYCQRIHKTFPEEYARVHKEAVKLVTRAVNPLAYLFDNEGELLD